MSLFETGRVLYGHTEFGPPPVMLFEFDPQRIDTLADQCAGLMRRIEQLRSLLGDRMRDDTTTRVDLVDEFGALVTALLSQAGCPTSKPHRRMSPFGKVIQLVVECDHGETARQAGEVINTLLFEQSDGLDERELARQVERFSQFANERRVDPDARSIYQAAIARHIPARWLDQDPFNPPDDNRAIGYGLLQLGQGIRQRRLIGAMPMPGGTTEPLNVLDRHTLMSKLVADGLPVPGQDLDFPNKNRLNRLIHAAERLGYPVVLRSAFRAPFADWQEPPLQVGPIENPTQLERAYGAAGRPRHGLWIEGWPNGDRYRFIVIGGQVHAAVSARNPTAGPQSVSPRIRELAESVAGCVGLDELAGIEMAIVDASGPADPTNCAVIDVFPDPRLDTAGTADHSEDGSSSSRQLAEAVVATLYPPERPSRIPILAVTGTNGKTTTTRMLARILRQSHRSVGLTTTDGSFVNDRLLDSAEATGVAGACLVLAEPDVDAAVLETARGNLLTRGAGFDRCDVAVCLNVSADHLGEQGVETIEQMAALKCRLLQLATQAVVVNADDPHCLNMLEQVDCRRHVLVAESADHPALKKHLAAGGEGVFDAAGPDGPLIVLARGNQLQELIDQHRIPATMNGQLAFNLENARHAAAVAWSSGIDIDAIRKGLETFDHTPEINPGRFNLFSGYPFKVLLDFAHNPVGIRGVLKLIEQMEVPGKRHLVCLTLGARHKDHIDEIAGELAQAFDNYVLGCYDVNVKKNADYSSSSPVEEMLGFFRTRMLDQGLPAEKLQCQSDRAEAIRIGLRMAGPGDLLVVLGHPEVSIPLLTDGRIETESTDSRARKTE